ncbi:MAG: hypothetical protein ACI965_000845, partial [Paraglaciecola sp.]
MLLPILVDVHMTLQSKNNFISQDLNDGHFTSCGWQYQRLFGINLHAVF